VVDDVDAPAGRFRMLETVRAFALQALAASGEEPAVRQAHAAYFGAFAEPPPFVYLLGDLEQTWVARLDPERDNLRAAFEWLERSGDVASLVRLAAALWPYGFATGLVAETRDRLRRALAAADASPTAVDPGSRAQAMMGLGLLAIGELAVERGLTLLTAARTLFAAVGDEENGLAALVYLAIGTGDSQDPAQAIPLFEEALRRAEGGFGPRWRPYVLRPFGLVVARGGDPARGEALLAEAVAVYRALGDTSNLTTTLRYLGEVAWSRGDVALTTAALLESIQSEGRDPEPWHLAGSLEGLALVACHTGDASLAARLLGAADVIRERSGVPIRPSRRPSYDQAVAEIRLSLGEDGYAESRRAGRALSADEVIAAAATLATPARSASEPAPTPADRHGLTDREIDVLRLIAQGKSNQQIADALGIRMVTAKTHVLHILAKLGLDSRVAAATFAHREGFV
jgi:non-specific serine/threonine protein kinase